MKSMTNWKFFVFSGFLLFNLSMFTNCQAGMVDMNPIPEVSDRINVGFNFAFTHHKRTSILDANTSDTDVQQSHGLNDTSSYGSGSIGATVWIPIMRRYEVLYSAVLSIDHMPGANVVATTVETVGAVQIKSHRTNFSGGINCVRFVNDSWFVELMLGGGVTRYHVRGEMWENFGNELEMDHPGPVSTSPYVNAEVGFGKQLSDTAKAYMFFNYSAARRDKPFRLTGEGDDESHINLLIPNRWWRFGLAFSHDINL